MESTLSLNETLDEEEAKNVLSTRVLTSALIISCLFAGAVGVYYYTQTSRPNIMSQLSSQFTHLGLNLTSETPAEVQRRSEIKKLPISYEEKQILLNRTIFMGASPRMVILALGKPKEGHKVNSTAENEESIILVYHLPKELRPTMLHFEQGKLVEAQKGSSIDFDTTPIPYTGTNSEYARKRMAPR